MTTRLCKRGRQAKSARTRLREVIGYQGRLPRRNPPVRRGARGDVTLIVPPKPVVRTSMTV